MFYDETHLQDTNLQTRIVSMRSNFAVLYTVFEIKENTCGREIASRRWSNYVLDMSAMSSSERTFGSGDSRSHSRPNPSAFWMAMSSFCRSSFLCLYAGRMSWLKHVWAIGSL